MGAFFRKQASHAHQRFPRSGVFFERMSKRRRGFPSETQVKRGVRIVHGNKELAEKLSRTDLCPCGSGKRFKKCCLTKGRSRRRDGSPVATTQKPPPAVEKSPFEPSILAWLVTWEFLHHLPVYR